MKLNLNNNSATEIPGLSLYTEVIDRETESLLNREISDRQWNTSINRHTQHFGYNYPYRGSKKLVTASDTSNISGLYPFSDNYLVTQLRDAISDQLGVFCDQGIVNKYDANTTIGKHIDDPNLFGDTIVGLLL